MNELRIQTLQCAEIAARVDSLELLRISAFGDWPHLHEGTLEYGARDLTGHLSVGIVDC